MAIKPIYLDNNATTPVDERVVAAMLPFFREQFGNPSSAHRVGASLAGPIDAARAAVARLIGASDKEIVFTSGGTESDNAALNGVLAARPDRRHVVISSVEHHAIWEPAERLEHNGLSISRVPVDRAGRLDLSALAKSVRTNTALVSVMLANNETGVVNTLPEVGRIAKACGALLHTDAVNAVGKLAVNVNELGVDLLSLSAHKFHGPKGAGALYVRKGTPFKPFMLGGPQEQERRGGTLNVPGIVGLGKAAELALESVARDLQRIQTLRDRFESALKKACPQAVIIAAEAPRLANTSCTCFPNLEAQAIVMLLSEAGLCVSSGAACASGATTPSKVLSAMGIPPELAAGQVRFSLSRETTDADIDAALDLVPRIIEKAARLRA